MQQLDYPKCNKFLVYFKAKKIGSKAYFSNIDSLITWVLTSFSLK